MRDTPDAELRAVWQQLRMVGDFDASMRHGAVRRAVESAARAMQARSKHRNARDADLKRRAANDSDE
jgi:hypothetical protein